MRIFFILFSLCFSNVWANGHLETVSIWHHLWSRSDQLAERELNKGHLKAAIKLFNDPEWRAIAYYRLGDYQKTLKLLHSIDSTDSRTKTGARIDYNRGNAWAKLGQYKMAISAYRASLKKDPDDPDAIHNIKVLKNLLRRENSSQMNDQNHFQKTSLKKRPSSNSKRDQKARKTSSQSLKSGQLRSHALPRHAHDDRWLRQIPDDPGGLLRAQFLRDHEALQQVKHWF